MYNIKTRFFSEQSVHSYINCIYLFISSFTFVIYLALENAQPNGIASKVTYSSSCSPHRSAS